MIEIIIDLFIERSPLYYTLGFPNGSAEKST